MKKSLIILLCIFTILGVSSYGLVKTIGSNSHRINADSNTLVTSFYPEYIITLNIIDNINNINLVNMTSETNGCLHDYQLTSKDMKTLTKADALIINGGGMEPFIEDIKKAFNNLPIIDSSANIELLPTTVEHNHSHNHDDNDHDKDDDSHHKNTDILDAKHDNNDEHNEHTEHDNFNSHVWLDFDNYITQINTITNSLCKIYPKHSNTFKANAKKYITQVNNLKNDLTTTTKSYTKSDKDFHVETILFHDSFNYLSKLGHLDVVKTVDIDSDTALSAGTVAEIISEIKFHGIKVLICEQQYKDSIATSVSKETDAKTYILDSLVSGPDSKEAYIIGMSNNIKTLKKIYSGIN